MEIPRDVLLAGARAYVKAAGGTLDIDPETMAQRIVDQGEVVTAAIVAAIEAWETRPHPWGELPATGTDDSERPTAWGLLGVDPGATGRNDPPAPDIDAERERFAAFAETEFRNGEGIAALIRQYYGREE